jgi:hypothetical protein
MICLAFSGCCSKILSLRWCHSCLSWQPNLIGVFFETYLLATVCEKVCEKSTAVFRAIDIVAMSKQSGLEFSVG